MELLDTEKTILAILINRYYSMDGYSAIPEKWISVDALVSQVLDYLLNGDFTTYESEKALAHSALRDMVNDGYVRFNGTKPESSRDPLIGNVAIVYKGIKFYNDHCGYWSDKMYIDMQERNGG